MVRFYTHLILQKLDFELIILKYRDKRQMRNSVETLDIGKQIWDIKYKNTEQSRYI